jgi:actin-like ATPase involved in cell morphogenesis
VRLAPVSLAALVAAVALAGCASQSNSKAADDYSGAQKDVVTVVDDLVNNATKKDGKEICTTVFAKDLAAELQQGAKDCADAVNDQLDDASNWDLDVVKNGVTVSGDTATVKTTSDFDGKTTNRTLTLAKQDNDWRITGIEGA